MRQRVLRWFRAWQERRNTHQYITGYQRHPESSEDWKALELVQVEAIAKELEDEEPWTEGTISP